MLIAALFKIATNWKWQKCLINSRVYNNIVNEHTGNEQMTTIGNMYNFTNVMLSERNQAQESTCHVILFR